MPNKEERKDDGNLLEQKALQADGSLDENVLSYARKQESSNRGKYAIALGVITFVGLGIAAYLLYMDYAQKSMDALLLPPMMNQ